MQSTNKCVRTETIHDQHKGSTCKLIWLTKVLLLLFLLVIFFFYSSSSPSSSPLLSLNSSLGMARHFVKKKVLPERMHYYFLVLPFKKQLFWRLYHIY